MEYLSRLTLLVILFVTTNTYAFTVYGFIPWRLEQNNTLISDQNQIKNILTTEGVQRIDVVYHNRMLTNGEVDKEKIKKIALDSQANPNIPISFDYEIGTVAKPETVLPNILKILDLYHEYGGKAPVGVYALLPVNTYGGNKLDDKRKNNLIALNKQYEVIATKVDFISPVFYFYDNEDLNAWQRSVDFNLGQSLIIAKKYNLKIYPYITNSFRISNVDPKTGLWTTKYINQNQMVDILKYLKEKGADGAIVWTASAARTEDGKVPVINFEAPWFQGIKKFINKE